MWGRKKTLKIIEEGPAPNDLPTNALKQNSPFKDLTRNDKLSLIKERMKSHGKLHLQEASKHTQTHNSLLSMFTVVPFMCKPIKKNNWIYSQIIQVFPHTDGVVFRRCHWCNDRICFFDLSMFWMCCRDNKKKNKG